MWECEMWDVKMSCIVVEVHSTYDVVTMLEYDYALLWTMMWWCVMYDYDVVMRVYIQDDGFFIISYQSTR